MVGNFKGTFLLKVVQVFNPVCYMIYVARVKVIFTQKKHTKIRMSIDQSSSCLFHQLQNRALPQNCS